MALTRVGGDNLKQPLTFPSGIIVTGVATLSSLNVTGNVSIAGTLPYEDVNNIDLAKWNRLYKIRKHITHYIKIKKSTD